MAFFKNLGKGLKKFVAKPFERVVVEPIAEHVVDPIAEHVVNPVREKVDHDFAIRDEMAAYDNAYDKFRKTYNDYADLWAGYAKVRVEYEMLSEEFAGEVAQNSGQYEFTEVPKIFKDDTTFTEFFEPENLLKVFTGQKLVKYFKSIGENEERIRKQTAKIRQAEQKVSRSNVTIKKEIKRMSARSRELRELYGEGGDINTHTLDNAVHLARLELVAKLSGEGLSPEMITEVTGWDNGFVQTALRSIDKNEGTA